MSHPENVRRTRVKAGLYLLSEQFQTPACKALSVWMKSSECRAMHVGSLGTTEVKLLFLVPLGTVGKLDVDGSRSTCHL